MDEHAAQLGLQRVLCHAAPQRRDDATAIDGTEEEQLPQRILNRSLQPQWRAYRRVSHGVKPTTGAAPRPGRTSGGGSKNSNDRTSTMPSTFRYRMTLARLVRLISGSVSSAISVNASFVYSL